MKFLAIQSLLILFNLQLLMGQSSRTFLFVGTYTEAKPDKGIYVYSFNSTTGELEKVSNGEDITNPSFLSLSPNGQFLYACTQTQIPDSGSVSAFAIDTLSGKFSFLNKQPSGGDNPVYLSVHKNNQFVVNANYTGGSVSVYRINKDGSLNPYSQMIQYKDSSIHQPNQDKSHIHSAVFSPEYDYIFLPDLGADKIRAYKFDASRRKPLIEAPQLMVRTVPGSGPRHFTFHPNHSFGYSVEELSGTISGYSYKKGKLDSIQRIFSYSTTMDTYGGADIHVAPDGRFLYASNRLGNENTIAIFSINQNNGKLDLLGHQSTLGEHPRNFTIDPSGNFLLVANLKTDNIVVFKRDWQTGLLTETGIEIEVPRPACLKMRKYGK